MIDKCSACGKPSSKGYTKLTVNDSDIELFPLISYLCPKCLTNVKKWASEWEGHMTYTEEPYEASEAKGN